jgi:hypothetical protein
MTYSSKNTEMTVYLKKSPEIGAKKDLGRNTNAILSEKSCIFPLPKVARINI